jgi:hypothetical protein
VQDYQCHLIFFLYAKILSTNILYHVPLLWVETGLPSKEMKEKRGLDLAEFVSKMVHVIPKKGVAHACFNRMFVCFRVLTPCLCTTTTTTTTTTLALPLTAVAHHHH